MARPVGSGAPRVGTREYRAQTRTVEHSPQKVARRVPASTFGPLHGPQFGQQQAARNVARARNRLPQQRTRLPAVPKLPHPSQAQRQAGIRLTSRAVNQRRLPGESAQQAFVRLSHAQPTRGQTQQAAHELRRQVAPLGGGGTGSYARALRTLTALHANAPTAEPGPKPKGGVAGLSSTVLGTATAHLLSPRYNAFLAAAPGFGKLTTPLVHDALSLPRNAVVSGFVTGRALEQAARGHPQRLSQLVKTIKQTDPLALAAQGKWNQALHAAGTHPLNFALEVSGIRAPLRGAGRLAGLSTEREAASLPGTALSAPRERSTNPLTHAYQTGRDAKRIAKADALRAEADHADKTGQPTVADELRLKANRADPRIMSERQVEHRADVRESMGQPLRRRGRTEVQKQLEPTYVRPREGGHMQRMNVEGSVPIRRVDENGNFDLHGQVSVKHLRQDIAAKLDRLKTEHSVMERQNAPRRLQRLNLRTQRHLEDLKGKSDAQLLNVAHKALDVSAVTNEREARLVARGMLHPEEARIARLKTYAFEHMGARVGRVSGASRDQLVHAVREVAPGEDQRIRGAVGQQSKLRDIASAAGGALRREQAHLEEGQKLYRDLRAKGLPLPKGMAERLADSTERVARREQEHQVAVRQLEEFSQKVSKRGTGHVEVLRPLHPDQIEAHMRENGVDPSSIAFVTQRPTGTVGAYNMSWRSAKGATTRTRTGQAVIQGLVDTHPRNLTANAVRLQQLEAANINWEHGLSEVAQRSGRGKVRAFVSKSQATNAAKEVAARTGMNWRPVQMIPWGGRESQLQHFLDHADTEGFVGRDHPVSQAIEQAVSEGAKGNGPWALVPDTWARRIEDHSQVYRSAHPLLRSINGMFRHTVLPLSLSWLTGNVAEAALRSVVKSPRLIHNFVTYKRVMDALKKIDPEEWAQNQDLLGVGHYGSMEQSNVYTSAAQFSNSRFRPVAEAMHQLRTAPGPGTLAEAYRRYTHFVFEHVNNSLERPFRQSMAGHHIRMALMDNSRAIHDSGQAVEEAAKGLRNTTAQVRLADDVRRAYGQYEAWGPGVRRAALLYTPFVPWAINAVRFLTIVLPKDHPALTAAIAAADTWTQDYRKRHGLDEWTKGAVPSFLLGSIPTGGGGHLRVSRYTPFGFAADPAGTIASQVMPQFSGVLDALNGRDWTGKGLKNKDGSAFTTDQKFSYAAGQFAQNLIPGLNILGRAIKAPGSNPAQKLAYVQNPFRVTKKKGSTGGGKPSSAPTKGGTVDWSKVKIPSGGTGVDWSKVKIGG